MSEPVAALYNLSKRYRDRELFRGLGLEIRAGEFVTMIGPSGAGKSTLLHILGGLDRRYEGTARVLGHDLARLDDATMSRMRARDIGFVFQGFNILDHLSVLENVELPAYFGACEPGQARGRALEALERVGLRERASSRPTELSGGQRQRVALARAVVGRPQLLLADEPTGNLDTRTGDQIIELFTQLHAEGLTLLIVTHEERVCRAAGRVLHLRDGALDLEPGDKGRADHDRGVSA